MHKLTTLTCIPFKWLEGTTFPAADIQLESIGKRTEFV